MAQMVSPATNGGLDGARFAKSGRLGGWAVGANPHFLPGGLAYPLPKGTDFVMQIHFHLSGKVEKEQSTIGLYFADKKPEKETLAGVQVPAVFGVGKGLDIPPGEKAYVMKDSFTLPVDVEGLAIGGHAHYLAKRHASDRDPAGRQQAMALLDQRVGFQLAGPVSV